MRRRLTWDYSEYNPYNLQKKPYDELKTEYKRLYKKVQARMKTFEKRGLTRARNYKRFMNSLKPGQIKNQTQLSHELSSLARIEASQLSTYRGEKAYTKKVIQTLHETGYTFINESNIYDFADFMEEFRAQKLDYLYDSKTAVEVFEKASKTGSLQKVKNNFEQYLKDQEKTYASYHTRSD